MPVEATRPSTTPLSTVPLWAWWRCCLQQALGVELFHTDPSEKSHESENFSRAAFAALLRDV